LSIGTIDGLRWPDASLPGRSPGDHSRLTTMRYDYGILIP
jgi:hypothetical protein